MLTLSEIQKRLEHAQLAGNIYQHDQILVLQAPYQDDGSALNVFAQDELSTDQVGLQFGIQVINHQIDYLIGITHSNQDRSYEISAGNLKGDQKAFNLIYAFYNFPKKFYLVRLSLNANCTELENTIEQQLFNQKELHFLHTAVKVSPTGESYTWIKAFILQQALEMKVRIQTSLI